MSISLPASFVTFIQRLVNAISASNSHVLLRHFRPNSEPAILASTISGLSLWPWPHVLAAWNLLFRRGVTSAPGSSSTTPAPSSPDPPQRSATPKKEWPIHRLMNNPTLFDPIRKPRNPIVLCHGLYGFDVAGPSSFPTLQRHYWKEVLQILRQKVGAEVVVTAVPSTGAITDRARSLDKYLTGVVNGQSINFIAHSMGGLDCRHLISNIRPLNYEPVSLTTVSTPHRGSPFMDWCTANIGIGSGTNLGSVPDPLVPLPSALINLLDEPAYFNLSTKFLRDHFNPNTPDSPSVRYFSVAARTSKMSFFHPLWLPKLVLDSYEEKLREEKALKDPSAIPSEFEGNDGLVTVTSAKWGEFLGIVDSCDHWGIRGAGGWSSDQFNMPSGTEEEEGWNWSDWSTFLGLWKDKGKPDQTEAAARKDVQAKSQVANTPSSVAAASTAKESVSTMETMLDWVSEHIPISTSTPALTQDAPLPPSKPKEKAPPPEVFDLEKFYVALSRKLYDEGL